MDKKLKEKWIKALRSGKYKQGKGALCKTGPDGEPRYCCLGVLKEIMLGKKLNPLEDGGLLKPAECKKAGINDYGDDKSQDVLIHKNDVERCKFSTIANFIEKNY